MIRNAGSETFSEKVLINLPCLYSVLKSATSAISLLLGDVVSKAVISNETKH